MSNPLSFSSIKLERFSKDGICLKPASGFVLEAGNQYYLITNWHVVSGRDILTGELLEPDLEPDTLKISLHFRFREGEKSASFTAGPWKKLVIELYSDNHVPRWIEPARIELQSMIDVVALPLSSNLIYWLSRGKAADAFRKFIDPVPVIKSNVSYWAEISAISISAIDIDVEYGPSDTVDVIGYPLDWAPAGTNKPVPSFWRRSSIASEIKGLGITSPEDSFFIDPCPLDGMTGSPIIGMKNDRLKLLGIYSDSSTAEFGANAGLVWNASVVKELISTS
jgi:hypothetical protein